MATSLLPTLKKALEAHDVTVTTTTQRDFQSHLESQITPPAVAAPLRDEGLSLPDHIPVHPTPNELRAATTGITQAGFGIAPYGTLLIESFPDGDEYISLYPPTHIAVLPEPKILPDMETAMRKLHDKITAGNDSFVFATGPSATADMGKLVQGVHGPETVHTIIITNE